MGRGSELAGVSANHFQKGVMQEHERQEYQRLRAEGTWSEASAFREAERKRLRKVGRNRQQACDESWAAMLKKFPAQGQVAPQVADDGERIEEVDEGVLIEHTEAERCELLILAQDPGAWNDSWSEALSWAYSHRKLDVTPKRAGSVLAWMLWKLCRADFQRFCAPLVIDYALRHGQEMKVQPATSEREVRLRRQMVREMEHDTDLARLDDEDQRLGKSPSLL